MTAYFISIFILRLTNLIKESAYDDLKYFDLYFLLLLVPHPDPDSDPNQPGFGYQGAAIKDPDTSLILSLGPFLGTTLDHLG